MAGIYIYSDKIEVAAELVAFAKSTGKPSTILTVSAAAAEAVAGFGADHVYLLEGGSESAERYGKAIAQLLKEEAADLFVAASTVRGRELAANVAGYLGCAMVSDIRSAEYQDDKLIATRMIYGGAVVQTERIDGLCVLTVPAALYEAGAPSGQTAITTKTVQADPRISTVGTEPIVKVGVDLKKAERIVSVGLGLNKGEDLAMIQTLADAMGAEVGCSRGVAEEKKWLPESQYVGITGVQVKPLVYVACGISGQAQHLFGIKDAKLIVAINSDESAPIFRACDYGIVGDMYEAIPLLTEALKNI